MTDKLDMWQRRLARNEQAYSHRLSQMDEREQVYKGSRKLTKRVVGDNTSEAIHVRNLTAEIVEAQVNSSIPQPKVTAMRQKDERKAKLIEDMLRNELNRLPFEQLNDQQERTVPIQGGGMFLVEWDNTERSHTTVGELAVSLMHPKQVIPQDGVYTGIEDMDYIILKLPQTKEYIWRRYGVDVDHEGEDKPRQKAEFQIQCKILFICLFRTLFFLGNFLPRRGKKGALRRRIAPPDHAKVIGKIFFLDSKSLRSKGAVFNQRMKNHRQ